MSQLIEAARAALNVLDATGAQAEANALRAAMAAAPAQVPLTEEQIDALPCTDGDGSDRDALMRFARAIERAHGIGK